MTVVAVDRDPAALTLTIVAEFDAPAERVLRVRAERQGDVAGGRTDRRRSRHNYPVLTQRYAA